MLVDNDPWGFYIYSVVKQGSINLAYESVRMAVPAARFIGLSSSTGRKSRAAGQRHDQARRQDMRRAKQMLAYPWFKQARLAARDPAPCCGAA